MAERSNSQSDTSNYPMSIKLGKLEINLNGTVGIIGQSVSIIGANLGFGVWEQIVPMSGLSYKYYEVDRHESGTLPLPLGIIVIEQTTEDNVLMTFGPVSDWLETEAVKAEYVELFWDFIDALLRQLLALGYVYRVELEPHEPKAPTNPEASNIGNTRPLTPL